MSYPIPTNETERLAALERLQIVSSPPTTAFDSVLALALELTGCRAGLIGLMERDRQWCMAEIGIGGVDMPRWVSLGNHTLMQTEPLIVEDLSRDPRFRDNLLVRERGVHFYAGVALAAVTGENVGTLCLTDRSPRAAEPELYDILRDIGRIIEGMLEAHAQTRMAGATAKMAEMRGQELWRKTRLIEQSERLAKIGAWELDLETQVFALSDEARRIQGLPQETILTLESVRSRMEPGLRSHATALHKRCMETGEGYEYKGQRYTVKGELQWVHVIAEAEHCDGRIVRFFGTICDITAEHQAEQALWRAAHHDPMTDAPNRHHWTIRLDEAVVRAQADQTALAILMLDLDGFKEINDTRGHGAGDQVLREVSRRLVEALPENAFHARLGGDEFAILLEGAKSPLEGAKSHLEGARSPLERDRSPLERDELLCRLLDALRRPITVDGTPLRISATFGGATYPDHASSACDLMRKADIALYQAKQSNRSAFLAYTSEIGDLFDSKRNAIDKVTAAIEANRLVPFYQPKIDLWTGAVIGFEALCRIQTDTGAILMPCAFEPALVDPVASARIGSAMLDLVIADIAAWAAEGLAPRRIALNLTGADFADGTLAERIIRRLADLGIPPAALEIELAEKTIRGKEAAIIDSALHALKDAGLAISLDNFGIGYGSLSRLRDAPVKSIKLDRSFVTDLDQTDDNSIIVRSIVDLAHSLSMRIVAEGIETMKEAEFARAVGCDEAQGSLFAPPMSGAHTRAALARMQQTLDPPARRRA